MRAPPDGGRKAPNNVRGGTPQRIPPAAWQASSCDHRTAQTIGVFAELLDGAFRAAGNL
jgi:hypothetical protein